VLCTEERGGGESNTEEKEEEREGKEGMLADKPLDFENCPLVQNNKLTKQRNLDEGERPMQALKLQFQN